MVKKYNLETVASEERILRVGTADYLEGWLNLEGYNLLVERMAPKIDLVGMAADIGRRRRRDKMEKAVDGVKKILGIGQAIK